MRYSTITRIAPKPPYSDLIKTRPEELFRGTVEDFREFAISADLAPSDNSKRVGGNPISLHIVSSRSHLPYGMESGRPQSMPTGMVEHGCLHSLDTVINRPISKYGTGSSLGRKTWHGGRFSPNVGYFAREQWISRYCCLSPLITLNNRL